MGKREIVESTGPAPLALEDMVRQSVTGVAEMRAEIDRLRTRERELEREVLMLKSEKEAVALVLEGERTERAYYHRFAVEVSAGLGLIGQIVDDVMTKAQTAAHRDDGKRGADLPDIKIPEFLLRTREGETNAQSVTN